VGPPSLLDFIKCFSSKRSREAPIIFDAEDARVDARHFYGDDGFGPGEWEDWKLDPRVTVI
jgi:hypothetical protein